MGEGKLTVDIGEIIVKKHTANTLFIYIIKNLNSAIINTIYAII